ncbi:MAG: hypothetical protein V4635_00240 [Bacteroidota bacterium]
MYQFLLPIHSLFRWLALLMLCYSIVSAYRGYVSKRVFSKRDNALRHWTATVAHVQLVIGFVLYFKSPVIHFFFSDMKAAVYHRETLFFAVIHFLLMLTAIVIITIGSALAKRKEPDHEKYKTMLLWFGVGLFIIFVAIPWPFSPLANRAYFKPF